MKGLLIAGLLLFCGGCMARADNDSVSHPGKAYRLVASRLVECEPEIVLLALELHQNYLYHAGNTLTTGAAYRIAGNAGANITMKAGFTIVLKPGTTVLKGNHYLATIEDCIPTCESSFTARKFFTPNGDGDNDYWNIHNLENITAASIYVFDRYGKLITRLDPYMAGWDGTAGGYKLPATDYWYLVTYTDCYGNQREERSHFSLIR